ncbi:MAG: response regulator [Pseudomonas sp.]
MIESQLAEGHIMRRATGPPIDTATADALNMQFQPYLNQTAAPTLFLDADLTILFFTPALSSLINILAVDIGRPLIDLSTDGLGADFSSDAMQVLTSGCDLEREIVGRDSRCYLRQISLFNPLGHVLPMISISFADHTSHQQLGVELARVQKEMETGRASHLRVLSALSHDLRQPLQTLKLLQALLRETLNDVPALELAEQIGDTLAAMSGMVNLSLDNTPSAANGSIAHREDIQIDTLFRKISPEFSHWADEQGTALRFIPNSQSVHSDPRLLEQMLRTMLSSALADSHRRVSVGCRRHHGWLSLEVRTSGVSVMDPLPDASALAEVERLSAILGHRLHRHTASGTGMNYAISIALSVQGDRQPDLLFDSGKGSHASAPSHRGIILIVEDDADLLKLLGTLLHHQGYEVAMALDSAAALSWIHHSGLKPDLILADYHLGTDMTGLMLIDTLREQWRSEVSAIVLTGDVSCQTALEIAAARCTQLNKPAKLKELIQLVHALFTQSEDEHSAYRQRPANTSVVYVVDSDSVMRDVVRQILQAEDYRVYDFPTCEAFLVAYAPEERACLLLDARLPGMNGVDALRALRQRGDLVPTIISGSGDIALAVDAMKAGAWDFIEKPFDRHEMLDTINRALGRSQHDHKILAGRQEAIDYIATLTARQRQIMELVLAGHPSKNIAVDLGISQRTVENHRASIMTRTHSRSIPALARLALAATLQNVEGAVMES